MSKERMKKLKWMESYQQERLWLEEMARKGWFLENITFGCIFTFVKGEPKHMLYDIDRFSIPKNPTLEEIRHKEMFFEIARELGWQEVTHGEDMTYFFAKEYEEDGINELHNDPESRRFMAVKYRKYYSALAKQQVFWAAVIVITCIFEKVIQMIVGRDMGLGWYDWFTLIYAAVCNFFSIYLWRLSERMEKELSMSRSEWEKSVDPNTHRTVRKLIWTNRGLNRFLRKQQAEGYVLTAVTATRYFFEKCPGGNQIYTMDSKSLVNERRVSAQKKRFNDEKDLIGINNDWEIASVKEAQEKGWTFVCALENRAIIYRGDAQMVQPLNDPKHDNSLRWISLIGEFGFYLLCCGLIGGIIGFISSYFFR